MTNRNTKGFTFHENTSLYPSRKYLKFYSRKRRSVCSRARDNSDSNVSRPGKVIRYDRSRSPQSSRKRHTTCTHLETRNSTKRKEVPLKDYNEYSTSRFRHSNSPTFQHSAIRYPSYRKSHAAHSRTSSLPRNRPDSLRRLPSPSPHRSSRPNRIDSRKRLMQYKDETVHNSSRNLKAAAISSHQSNLRRKKRFESKRSSLQSSSSWSSSHSPSTNSSHKKECRYKNIPNTSFSSNTSRQPLSTQRRHLTTVDSDVLCRRKKSPIRHMSSQLRKSISSDQPRTTNLSDNLPTTEVKPPVFGVTPAIKSFSLKSCKSQSTSCPPLNLQEKFDYLSEKHCRSSTRPKTKFITGDQTPFRSDYRPAPPPPPPMPFPVMKICNGVENIGSNLISSNSANQYNFRRTTMLGKRLSRNMYHISTPTTSVFSQGLFPSRHRLQPSLYRMEGSFAPTPLLLGFKKFLPSSQPFRQASFPHHPYIGREDQSSFRRSKPNISTLEEGEIYDVFVEEHQSLPAYNTFCYPSRTPQDSQEIGARCGIPQPSQPILQPLLVNTQGQKSLISHDEAWTIDSVTLSSNVFNQLAPSGLLDDTVLEFFFRFLYHYVLTDTQRDAFFLFNSYFYTKLGEGGSNKKLRHAGVQRWTNRLLCLKPPSSSSPFYNNDACFDVSYKKKNLRIHLEASSLTQPSCSTQNSSGSIQRQYIWEFDTVVIPIHNSAHHWTLTLVCYPYLAIKSPDNSRVPKPRKTLSQSVEDLQENTNLDISLTSSSKLTPPRVARHSSPALQESVSPNHHLNEKVENQDDIEITEKGPVSETKIESLKDLSENTQLDIDMREKINHYPIPVNIPGPAIFHLDSLQHTAKCPLHLKNIIVEYFQEEFRVRCPSLHKEGYHVADHKDWIFDPKVAVPHQLNNYDCGVFLIEYLRYLFIEPERVETLLYNVPCIKPPQQDSEKLSGHQGLPSWFHSNQIAHRRACLQKMLVLMLKYPDWKTSKRHIPCNGQLQTPLQIIVGLFNSTNPKDLDGFKNHVDRGPKT